MRAEDFFSQVARDFPEVAEAAAEVDPPFVLASNVYRLRKQRGLTQEQLAEAVGVRQPRIAEVERGDANPRLDTLAKLARALGVPVAGLLDPDFPDRADEAPPVFEYRRRVDTSTRKVAEP